MNTSSSKQKASPEFLAWKQQATPENHAALMKTLDPIINSAVMSFAGGDKQYLTRARILANQSLDTYDPQAGAALPTHVYNNLKRLQRVRAERANALHMPESVRTDRQQINSFVSSYTNTHGVPPSQETIVDNMKMSPKRMQKTLIGGELSSEQMTGEKGEQAASARAPADAWMDYVYHDLGETDKIIYELATGKGGVEPVAKAEIARRLGISAPAVSQRISKIANMLSEVPA